MSVFLEANSKVSESFVEETDIGVSINIKSMGILSESTDVKEYQYFEMRPFEDVQKFFKEYAFKETDKKIQSIICFCQMLLVYTMTSKS